MSELHELPAHPVTGARSRPRRPPKKAPDRAKSGRPIQLTIFDYAAALGVTLFPDQAARPAPKPRRRRKAKAS